MSSNFILPYYAPRKLSPVKRAIKDSDIPSEANKLLQLVYTIIHNRPRHFKQTPLDRPKHWWQWDHHRRPTKWSLYRHLINHSSWLDHQLIQPAPTQSNSNQPSSTPVLTNWIRSEFKRHKTLRTIPHTQEVLRQAYLVSTLPLFTSSCPSLPVPKWCLSFLLKISTAVNQIGQREIR